MSKEIVLDDYAFLVSETDEKGIIVFANDDFCKVAGYHIDELIATKDGDYYWVFATVYPTITSEGTKGYLSCRRKASAEEIQAHENLYKQLRMSEKAA